MKEEGGFKNPHYKRVGWSPLAKQYTGWGGVGSGFDDSTKHWLKGAPVKTHHMPNNGARSRWLKTS